jgi:hypothetical protein
LIGGGKVGEAKNFLYIIPGEDWGVGEGQGGFKKQFKRGKTIEKVYRKRGQATPLPPKASYKKLGYRKNLSYIYVLP